MKLAVIVTENYSAWNFRRELLKAAVDRGIETYLVAPSGDYDNEFTAMGVRHIPIDVDRVINPPRDIHFLVSLYRIIRQYEFDTVHNISIKPNIYGALAARMAGVANITGSVTGLGSVYLDEMGYKFRLIRPLVSRLYRFSFGLTDRVWFQNPDDAAYFVAAGMVSEDKVVIIRGSGVNVDSFSSDSVDPEQLAGLKRELGIDDDAVVISMFARALKSKGVDDFIEAARILERIVPQARFLFVGDVEPGNPLSLSQVAMSDAAIDNYDWLGWRHDVRELMELSDIVVLPSRFREGVPKSLLEAMAMGKPIVTTSVAGCKETVNEGYNGYQVTPGDTVALASAIGRLALNESRREDFGRHSRQLAEDTFDIDRINKAIIEDVYLWKKES